jgi:hypothetical protein
MDPVLLYHNTSSIYCWCGPKLAFEPNSTLRIVVSHRVYKKEQNARSL